MSELRLETLEVPAARLGAPSPLAALRAYRTVSIPETPDTPAKEAAYADRGNEASILPYGLQDDYDREKKPRRFKVAVLENEFLRATFMLELGGRLWSLYHKPAKRELLHVNPVFQPANLAVRDAWFSGGVEWNLSIIGHCPVTCSPVFAARAAASDGTPILRLYEFERIRGVPFQIDCFLPDGSEFLFVRPQITNPNDETIPMYWWSNIAVEEADEIRVLAPAEQAYFHAYDRSLRSQALPMRDGRDMTYPTRLPAAGDLYFRIAPDHRPWIAALDRQGSGLVHTSTARLMGRKMFNWGTAPGGQTWQEHLSVPGNRYLEIQGGLAPKQTEYVPMPAGAKWQWLEAYGLLTADAHAVHSHDWPWAIQHVDERLEEIIPRSVLDEQLKEFGEDAARPPVEILQPGSGWGALENHRRARAGIGAMGSPGIPFPNDTLGPEQQPWLQLLEEDELPPRDPAAAPGAYMTQPQWKILLEEAIAANRGVHWLSLLHLGTMRYRACDGSGAREAWERSLELEKSAWALRSLAVLAADEGDPGRAADLWLSASKMQSDIPALVIEACEALLGAGRFAELRGLIGSLPREVQGIGRVRLLDSIAGLRSGDLRAPGQFFSTPFDIPNFREGETSVSELWFDWHEALVSRREGVSIDESLRRRVRREYPLPRDFDFRMTPDETA
ncbi:MAG TPA: DUF5107 domain-containing protein [Tepidisphaeraceae bacterium]|jgi:hypothetical protein|nr:DUF5107 domain-containing protein [Tepidisphaeraceae bacterium]